MHSTEPNSSDRTLNHKLRNQNRAAKHSNPKEEGNQCANRKVRKPSHKTSREDSQETKASGKKKGFKVATPPQLKTPEKKFPQFCLFQEDR